MKFEINLVFYVLVVLASSSQTKGQGSALLLLTSATLPSHDGISVTTDLTEDPDNEVTQWTHDPSGENEASSKTTTTTKTEGIVHSVATSQHMKVSVVMSAHTGTASSSDSLSSTPTVQRTTPLQHISATEGLLTRDPLTTFSSQPAHTVQDASSIKAQSGSLTTATAHTIGHPLASTPGWGPAAPTHQEVPSELNVGDEDVKQPHYRSSSPLDPLLAGLLSVFIVVTAIVFVILFLKFRQQTNHPEFHRLQDLPMDDLMEDTPLSRYTY
uniref:Uncharacterized protein n=1 Tax=Monopterus albus TaxID=43700 RepID=A0A3Q3IUD5_MONAL|nr:uncharacterized protein LOC109970638 [Monopterus albus]